MAREVRIGLVQFVPERWDVKGNWRRLDSILRSASKNEYDLVVTPECIVDGYTVSEAPKDPKVPWAGRERWLGECALDASSSRILKAASRHASRLGSYLVLGYTRLLGSDTAANAATAFGRRGEVLDTYHKTHLQNHDLQFAPGRGWSIIDADFGRFGVLICADRRWPEAVRCQRLLGAELLANPTYGMHGDLNLAMMRTRAFENNFFIAFCHPRQSLITGPGGEVEINVCSEIDGLVSHAVDLERTNLSHVKDRRTDLYVECRK